MNQPRSHGRHWCKEEAAFLGPEQPQPLHSQIAHWSWLSLLCGWISASQNAIGRPRCSTCNSVLSETSSPFKRMELFFFGWGTPETSSAMLNDVVCFWHIYFRENRWRKQTPQWSHKHVSYMFIYIIKKKNTTWNHMKDRPSSKPSSLGSRPTSPSQTSGSWKCWNHQRRATTVLSSCVEFGGWRRHDAMPCPMWLQG